MRPFSHESGFHFTLLVSFVNDSASVITHDADLENRTGG
jgi:hypothetical protein